MSAAQPFPAESALSFFSSLLERRTWSAAVLGLRYHGLHPTPTRQPDRLMPSSRLTQVGAASILNLRSAGRYLRRLISGLSRNLGRIETVLNSKAGIRSNSFDQRALEFRLPKFGGVLRHDAELVRDLRRPR